MYRISSKHPRRSRLAVLLVSTALASALVAPIVSADAGELAQASAVHRFDIPPQPLSDALAVFGQQSGMQVSAPGDAVRGLRAPGVSGTMSADAALSRLLAETGLTFTIDGTGAIIAAPLPTGDSSATMLQAIAVQGALGNDRHAGAADRANSLYVTSEDLERRNPTTVKEVFAGEASVSVGGAQPLSQKVYVQGVEETNLAVSIDGARQNNKTFHHTGNNIIDPSLLKRVRVDPGVAPADAGPGALGGAIVYETVDVADVLARDRSLGGFVSSSYDTNGDTFFGSASAYGRMDQFDLLGFFTYGTGGRYEDGNGDTVAGTKTDLRSFLVKGGYEPESGHRLELSAEQVHDDAPRPFRANIGRLTNRPDPPERGYELLRENYTLNYESTIDTGLWDPRVVLGYGVTELKVPDPFGSVGTTGSLSARLENEFHLTAVDSITAGVDFYDDKAVYEDPGTDVEENATNVGAYAQARLRPLEPLALSFGLRVDHQWFEGVDGTDMQNTGVSGNVSVAYDLFDFLTLNAGYSNVWGGISLAENFIMNPAWSYDDIEPVRAENYTVGFEAYYEGFTFGASVFRNDFEDARDPTFGGGPSLTTDFVTEGYTLSAGYRWRLGFVRVSYIDSEIEVDGSPADSDITQYLGAPLGQIIAVEAAHRFAPIGVTVGGTVDVALKNTDTEAAGFDPLEGYEVVNLYAEYQPDFARFLTLRVEANNIFDEAYADRATYGQEFANVEPLREPGRSFLIKAKATF